MSSEPSADFARQESKMVSAPDHVRQRVWLGRTSWIVVVVLAAMCVPALAQYNDYDQAPINYSNAAVSDPIAKLQKKMLSGKASLNRQGEQGYLKSVLKALDIPVSSQTLVFSKTSFQREVI